MAREKGTGNLQQEKSGRWTVRVGINGRRLSRSARTTDRDKAEKFLERFLAPLGLGTVKLPLAEARNRLIPIIKEAASRKGDGFRRYRHLSEG